MVEPASLVKSASLEVEELRVGRGLADRASKDMGAGVQWNLALLGAGIGTTEQGATVLYLRMKTTMKSKQTPPLFELEMQHVVTVAVDGLDASKALQISVPLVRQVLQEMAAIVELEHLRHISNALALVGTRLGGNPVGQYARMCKDIAANVQLEPTVA